MKNIKNDIDYNKENIKVKNIENTDKIKHHIENIKIKINYL